MKSKKSVASLQLNSHKKHSVFQRIVTVFAAIAVFVTCYALIIPAITMTPEDADTVCGLIAHAHTDECYDESGMLVCDLPEHEHDMQCYAGAKMPETVYACGYGFEHTHDENCCDENGTLVCDLSEHTHTDECTAPSEKKSSVTDIAEKKQSASETAPIDTAGADNPVITVQSTSTQAFDTYLTSTVLDSYGEANDWQIISGKYGDPNAKVDVDAENHMRVRKRVVPTDVENEFLIDLSIDLDYRNLISSTLINGGTGILIQSSKQMDAGDDGRVNQQANCNSAWDTGKSTNANPAYIDKNDTRFGKKSGLPWKLTFVYPQDGGGTTSVSVIRYCIINTFSNGWVDMKLYSEADKGYIWYAVGEAAKGEGQEIVITLESSMVQKVLAALENVEIGTLQDSMGGSGSTVGSQTFQLTEGIDVTEIVYSGVKGTEVDDNATVSKDKDGRPYIEWKPVVSSLNASETDGNGWFNNIAELVYKVKYTPGTSTGLSSSENTPVTNTDAQIETNKATSIGYITTDTSGNSVQKTLNITSPVITGLLYEVNASKVDKSGAKLPGADFELYIKGKQGEADTLVDTASSDKDGKIHFGDLIAGTYYIKETKAPEGYIKAENDTFIYNLSYTDGVAPLKGQGKGENVLYSPAEPITIVNMPRSAVVLPQTGGIGTYFIYSGGFLITLSAAILYIKSKKKKQLI